MDWINPGIEVYWIRLDRMTVNPFCDSNHDSTVDAVSVKL